MADECLGFILFTNDHMIDNVDGVEYDQPACGGFSINVNNELVFNRNVTPQLSAFIR